MNPGQLNKRLKFFSFDYVSNSDNELFTVWGKKTIKNKRRDDEQNEERYEFVIRKRSNIVQYMTLVCEGETFTVFTIDEKQPGYLTLLCEKDRIHSFFDTGVVKRNVEVDKPSGETVFEDTVIYPSIPGELVKIQNARSEETDQQNDISQYFLFYTQNKFTFKVGDKLEVTHKNQVYKGTVEESFKLHTHQQITFKLEGEA
jgi:Phage head-tail joining protein